jgi:hypothetical protein
MQEAEQEAEQRRFARTVWAKQAKDFTSLDA